MAAAVKRVVAGDHHGPQAHPPQPLEALGDARLEDVFQHHHPGDAVALADQQRRGPLARPLGDLARPAHAGTRSVLLLDVTEDGVGRPFADLPAVGQIDAAHPASGP